jgi:transcriptional regulator GlxA family with amidase domain
MARLERLHAAAGSLAEEAPDVIANPEAARGLEQALIHALVACLATEEATEDPSARRRQAEILRRFRTTLEATADRALYVPELCAAIGVSDRTLRFCCHEHLGMSPLRYLWLRRMHLARRALVLADPASATVTTIAMAHGFWEFGRFAVTYRALFGEQPSTTLRRPPDGSRMPQFRTIGARNVKSA